MIHASAQTAHEIIDPTPHPRYLRAPRYAAHNARRSPDAPIGPYGAIARQNNAYAIGRSRIVPPGYERVTIGVVFEATRAAARGVALDGFNVYQISETRYIAHRPRAARR